MLASASVLAAQAAPAVWTTAWNVAGSVIAISASIFRLISMSFFFRPPMRRE